MRGYLEYHVPTFGIEGALAAITAIIFSVRLVYVSSKIITIGFEDENIVDNA